LTIDEVVVLVDECKQEHSESAESSAKEKLQVCNRRPDQDSRSGWLQI